MTFKKYLLEDVFGPVQGEDVIELAEKIKSQIKKLNLFNTKLVYRGFHGNNSFNGISRVTNKRTGFYGDIDVNLKTLISDLRIKNPTFITPDKTQALLFGSLNIYVPGVSDTFYYNLKSRDSLTNSAQVDDFSKTNKLQQIKGQGEIITSTKEYYLVNPKSLDKATKSKYKPKTLKTYGDLYKLVNSFCKYWSWKKSKG